MVDDPMRAEQKSGRLCRLLYKSLKGPAVGLGQSTSALGRLAVVVVVLSTLSSLVAALAVNAAGEVRDTCPETCVGIPPTTSCSGKKIASWERPKSDVPFRSIQNLPIDPKCEPPAHSVFPR